MRKSEIRSLVDKKLADCGFGPALHSWDGPKLLLCVGDELETILFKSGTAKYRVYLELGKIEAYGRVVANRRAVNGRRNPSGSTPALPPPPVAFVEPRQVDLERYLAEAAH